MVEEARAAEKAHQALEARQKWIAAMPERCKEMERENKENREAGKERSCLFEDI